MTDRATRLASVCLLTLLAACSSERAVMPKGPEPEVERRPAVSPIGYALLTASLTLPAEGASRKYQSDSVRFQIVKQKGKILIPSEVRSRLVASMHGSPLPGSVGRNAQLKTSHSDTYFQLASASTDPEQDLFAFAEANPAPDEPEDVFLEQKPWEMLTGDYYAEDISGSGTIAEVFIDPVSTTNPHGSVHLYLNGRLVATVNPQYVPESNGWFEETSNAATYAYSGGSTSSGSRTIDKEQLVEPVSLRLPGVLKDNMAPVGKYLLNSLLPAQAQAQRGCGYYMRGTLIGLAGMAWNARTGNIGGYFLSWAAVVNNMHRYARCREAL